MTQDELAERIFTTKQTIHKYETGIVTNIPSDKIELLANVFNVSPVYLMAWDNDDQDLASGLFPLETKRFPLLGEISCGEPIFVNEDRERYKGISIDVRCNDFNELVAKVAEKRKKIDRKCMNPLP